MTVSAPGHAEEIGAERAARPIGQPVHRWPAVNGATAWAGRQSPPGRTSCCWLTAPGMAIRFSEDEVRPMGLAAAGVMGIKLAVGDELAGVELLPQVGDVFLVTDSGQGKTHPGRPIPAAGPLRAGCTGLETQPERAPDRASAIGKGTTRLAVHSTGCCPNRSAWTMPRCKIERRAAPPCRSSKLVIYLPV